MDLKSSTAFERRVRRLQLRIWLIGSIVLVVGRCRPSSVDRLWAPVGASAEPRARQLYSMFGIEGDHLRKPLI